MANGVFWSKWATFILLSSEQPGEVDEAMNGPKVSTELHGRIQTGIFIVTAQWLHKIAIQVIFLLTSVLVASLDFGWHACYKVSPLPGQGDADSFSFPVSRFPAASPLSAVLFSSKCQSEEHKLHVLGSGPCDGPYFISSSVATTRSLLDFSTEVAFGKEE